MSKLTTLQIIWLPVPTLIFVSLMDWIASFGSRTFTFIAFTIYLYTLFAPALVAVFLAKKDGEAMSIRHHFIVNGGHFTASAADAFLVMAISAYGPGEPPAPGLRAQVDAILASATAAGFGQADIFVTIISKGEQWNRQLQMAKEVTADVGGDAAMIAMIKDFNPKGAAQ